MEVGSFNDYFLDFALLFTIFIASRQMLPRTASNTDYFTSRHSLDFCA